MMRLLLVIIFALPMLLPTRALSEDQEEGILNRLLAPGPLIEGHKDLEGKDCLKCHDAGKGVPEAKCLACHKPIKVEVETKKGFHGLTKQACIECHSDHKGRTYDTTVVDVKAFDHNLTGYKLEGKHAELKCSECHVEKRTHNAVRKNGISFIGKQTSCTSCHKKDDVHFFKGDWAGKDCSACHGLKDWKKDLKFDHARDAKYKLEGKHAELKCAECHVPPKKQSKTVHVSIYKWPNLKKSECMVCHENIHKTNLSPRFSKGNCTECHSQTTWKIPEFDHAVTNYPLRGKHAELKCEECHKQQPSVIAKGLKAFNFTGLKSDCLSCHKDFHHFGNHVSKKLGNLNKCLSCHNEADWKKTHGFDHNTQTRYKIDGEHMDLKCNECHMQPERILARKVPNNLPRHPVYLWPQLLTKTCENCHANPHVKNQSKEFKTKKCNECHVTEGWAIFKRNGKIFDHNKTRFPLTGKHTSLTCRDCHLVNGKEIYKFSSFEGHFCSDCHANQHVKQFEPKFANRACYECHTTKNFDQLPPFDHNQTRFKLFGSHKDVACKDCHIPTKEMFKVKNPHPKGQYLFPKMADEKACATCHADFHKGQLGQDCAKCHNETKWKDALFDHNKQSRFTLTGQHAKTKCEDCHKAEPGQTVVFDKKTYPVVHYKPINTNCSTCHEDYHKGQLAPTCGDCHTTDKWRPVNFDHNTQARFKLEGKHVDVKCGDCHKPVSGQSVKFKGQEFKLVRYKPLPSQCLNCHKDPHKGTFGNKCEECHVAAGWHITRDFHKNFLLSGVHYTLACGECHKNNRRLAGLSQECIFCHQKDDIHSGTLPNCKDCHRQHFWEITEFRHSVSRFPLTGAHRTIDCASCHQNNIFQGTPQLCSACHLHDGLAVVTPNHKQFANLNDCGSCHNTFTFSIAK